MKVACLWSELNAGVFVPEAIAGKIGSELMDVMLDGLRLVSHLVGAQLPAVQQLQLKKRLENFLLMRQCS
jgi:hypothetical protein